MKIFKISIIQTPFRNRENLCRISHINHILDIGNAEECENKGIPQAQRAGLFCTGLDNPIIGWLCFDD